MATAITGIEKKIASEVDEEKQSIEELLQAARRHKEPLLAFLDILSEMHQFGLLEAAQALLKNKKQIVLIGLDQMNKPGAHRIIKNGMGAVEFLASIEPAKLQTLLNGVSKGVELAADPDRDHKQPGIWAMAKSLRQPEMLASLSMMMNFLKGMGQGLRKTH
ncbi:DUF1641 domain-containing protein [Paenibacillus filicis]|uniref:DUF1641 domain-containing protein n=1 Tax=Paenibacillus gyeongsangnamensis TaxID=3388067 RepID=A0ABT4QBM9_9BACL|nr:DUF1641 domain-containing protein [Paenibacillus filicis]MCZ8514299.1 DUF1641 domain-containing protein [Paenibacillus filicis]